MYPDESLTQFAAFYDFRAATVAAAPLFVVTLIILGLQAGLYRRVLQLGRRTPSEDTVQIGLGPHRSYETVIKEVGIKLEEDKA